MKVLILFSLFFFFPVLFLILGQVFFHSWILSLIGLFITVFFGFFADKILLTFFKIKKNNLPGWAENFIKNEFFKLRILKFRILTTQGKNIYTTDGFFGQPRIILGEDFFNHFSQEECCALIYASILRIKNKDSRFRCISSLFINIFFWPLIKFPSENLKVSFLSLRYLIRSRFYKNKNEIISFDKSLGLYRIPFASALFKLNLLSENENFFLEDLSFSENKVEHLIRFFIDVGYDYNSRYQDLLRENGKV